MADVQAPLPSPGVGARRKGPKSLPRLPLSAFSPPNSGTSEKFPLPPSPSTIHPTAVVDSYVSVADVFLDGWKADVGRSASRKITGVVLAVPYHSEPDVIDKIVKIHPSFNVLSVLVPVDLNQGPPTDDVPTFGDKVPISLTVSFVKNSPQLVEGVKWALGKGYVVDINVQASEGWEGLEELLSSVLGSGEDGSKVAPGGAIILSNILPPPHDLSISIVKLLNHPKYRAYQSDTASLSLFPSVYVKYIPPHWGALTPATSNAPSRDGSTTPEETKEKKEWKRRIKMYLGPAVEAFGYQRIIYGSAPTVVGSNSDDWYEIARESVAELGVDQEGVDAVFGTNASAVYGA